MSTVFLPSSLRPLADGADKLTARGRNVRELIDDLESRFPGMRAALIENGELALHFAVSVDDVVSAEGLEERVKEDSEVHFVPPLGGG